MGEGRIRKTGAKQGSRPSRNAVVPTPVTDIGNAALQVGSPEQWQGHLDESPAGGRALIGALADSAGNAAVQRLISTSLHGTTQPGRRRGPAKPATSPGPGKAGRAKISMRKSGAFEMPIESFSFGGRAKMDAVSGAATGKTKFSEVTLTRQSDERSPQFMSAASNNEVMTLEVDLTSPSADGSKTEVFTYTFTSAAIRSFQQSGGSGSPTDSLSLTFDGWSLSTPDAAHTPDAEGQAGSFMSSDVAPKPMQVHGVSWGATRPTDAHTGRAAGGLRRQAVVITKDMDHSSPALLKAMQSHKVLHHALITLNGAPSSTGKAAPPAGEMAMKNAQIESVQQGATGGRPVETVTLTFEDLGVKSASQGPAVDAPATMAIVGTKSGNWSTPVLSWEWGMSSPTDHASGQASGKRQHHPFEIKVPAGPATSRFLDALASNENLKTVSLQPKSGPAYGLAQARVVDFQMASDDQRQPTTTVKLTYESIAEQAGKNSATDTKGEGPLSAMASGGASNSPGPGKAGEARVAMSKSGSFSTPIESFSFGGMAPGNDVHVATGRTQFKEMTFTRQSDESSPKFFNAEATNEAMSIEVDIVSTGADGNKRVFTYAFTQARLAAFTQSGGAGSPTDRLSVAFGGWSLAAPDGAVAPEFEGHAGTLASSKLGGEAIHLHSVAWGANTPVDAHSGMASGRMHRQGVTITKAMDRSSPLLLGAMQKHQVLPGATLTISGGTPASGQSGPPAGTIDLANVTVDSVTQTAGKDGPMETVVFGFEDLNFDAEGTKVPVDAPASLAVDASRAGKWEAPVLEWKWGITTPSESGTGRATGKRRLQDFEITVPAGPATAHLLSAFATNEALKSVALVPKSGPAYSLGSARVVDLQLSSDDKQQPTTVVRLVYQQISETAGQNEATDSRSAVV